MSFESRLDALEYAVGGGSDADAAKDLQTLVGELQTRFRALMDANPVAQRVAELSVAHKVRSLPLAFPVETHTFPFSIFWRLWRSARLARRTRPCVRCYYRARSACKKRPSCWRRWRRCRSM